MANLNCQCEPHCCKCFTLQGGVEVTPEEAKIALEAAMKIIEKVGTTGIYHQSEKADAWMKKYFPAWA